MGSLQMLPSWAMAALASDAEMRLRGVRLVRTHLQRGDVAGEAKRQLRRVQSEAIGILRVVRVRLQEGGKVPAMQPCIVGHAQLDPLSARLLAQIGPAVAPAAEGIARLQGLLAASLQRHHDTIPILDPQAVDIALFVIAYDLG